MAGKKLSETILKLFRLWRLYAYMDFIWMVRDIRYFLTCLITNVLVNIAGVTAVLLLAERFNGIGAWSKPQMVFMLGYATTVNGIMEMCFTFNVLHISRRIGRGQLDHTLIQPQPLWVAFLTEGFMPFSGSGVLLTGLALLGWAIHILRLPMTPGWLALLAVYLLSSSMVMLAFSFLWGSLAFRAPRAAEEISSAAVDLMSGLRSFPLDGVGGMLTITLLTALPVGFIAWYPSRYLLGITHGLSAGMATPLAAVVLLVLAVAAFRRGLRYYVEYGSQRYSNWGHRS